jgi:hypothetical protein
LKLFLKKAAGRTADWGNISFEVPLTKLK